MFIDTSSKFLTLILERNNILVDSLYIYGEKKHVDQTNEKIIFLLKKNNLRLRDVESFYITKGPGGYTGIKVSMAIVKTIKTINNNVSVYWINSLVYQAGGSSKTISMIDARNEKYYFSVIDNGKEIIPTKVLNYGNCLKIIKQFPKFVVKKNLEEINYLNNYFELKNKFDLVSNVEDLNPFYIKEIIPNNNIE